MINDKIFGSPSIVEKATHNMCSIDIYSKLLSERIIWVDGEITGESATDIISSLLYLASVSDDDITMYIHTPGGSVDSGFAILDTMNLIKPDVVTINVGLAASMGSILLSGGTKGKRKALKHSKVMIHQPSSYGGYETSSDLEIRTKQILKCKQELYTALSEHTGKSIEQIEKDADRDYWLTAEEALEYGLIDEIIK